MPFRSIFDDHRLIDRPPAFQHHVFHSANSLRHHISASKRARPASLRTRNVTSILVHATHKRWPYPTERISRIHRIVDKPATHPAIRLHNSMGAVPETAGQPSPMAIVSTPSTVATTTSEASSPPHLSEIEDLGYDNVPHTNHGIRPVIDGHATGVSSTEASSPELSAHKSQGRYDNTVNEYDLVKEASRAKGQKSRTVCVAIPVNRKDGTVLMVTSRKHDTKWICKSPVSAGDHNRGAHHFAMSQSPKEATRRARRTQKQQSGRHGKKVLDSTQGVPALAELTLLPRPPLSASCSWNLAYIGLD